MQFFLPAGSGDLQIQDPTVFQAYYDSSVDLFTWGTPIVTIALLTFLLHLGIETKTWVRAACVATSQKSTDAMDPTLPCRFMRSGRSF